MHARKPTAALIGQDRQTARNWMGVAPVSLRSIRVTNHPMSWISRVPANYPATHPLNKLGGNGNEK
ncbi:MAG TPA: hypothetical protein VGN24_06815 [Rhodanobacter sp.]|jgi:hypothetical protein|nr:hypothetical protein [Rhodanobacter sp.]